MAIQELKQEPRKNGLAFILAIILLNAFVVFFGMTLFYPNMGIDTAGKVAAIFGGWVGAVIGYYFGAKPIEKLQEEARALIESSRNAQRDLEQERKRYQETRVQMETERADMTRKMLIAEKDLNQAKTLIEEFKSEFIQ